MSLRHGRCTLMTLRRSTCYASRTLQGLLYTSSRRHKSGKDDDSWYQGVIDYQARAKDLLRPLQRKGDELQQTVLKSITLPQVLSQMPDLLSGMKDAFEFKSGSIGAKIIDDAKRSQHASQIASVRIGEDACKEEVAFRTDRLQFSKMALAKYLDLDAQDINLDDIPVIGIAASGGGLRACLNTTSYYEIMQEEGLLDVTAFMAGISGSTWAQALFFDSSIGQCKAANVIKHLKEKTSTHIIDPASNLEVLQDEDSRKYVLRSLLERFHAGYTDLGLTDIYGIMLANRFFVPSTKLREQDLLISTQAARLSDGQNPMPIYSCVRHEIPAKTNKDQGETDHASSTRDRRDVKEEKAHFQFFEFTPFEFGSEELQSWIPTWATGRNFKKGTSSEHNAEIGLSTLLGTFSSAFCAPLSSYLLELEPLIATNTRMFAELQKQIAARNDQFSTIQMIDATRVPNYALDADLPDGVSKHMSRLRDLELSDAGMDNNLPFYPLLRRECDIIIALDSSADIDTTPWFTRTEGYAKQRKIKSWPIGIGWPESDKSAKESQDDLEKAVKPEEKVVKDSGSTKKKYSLGGVNVWIGESSRAKVDSETSDAKARMVDEDWEVVSKSVGTMLIYMPMVPHPDVPDVIPESSEHLSTWNFVYTREQIDGVRQLARANFDSDKIKKAVKAMYLRKKQERQSRQSER